MSDTLVDAYARERFRTEWHRNFAVNANAGSGKTTAISARLATMAQSADAPALLSKTAVVTFTKKAAAQIGQRARGVLLAELGEGGARDLTPLDHLERAFFGTIHSFCLLLARRYGQQLGIHLNPTVIAEDDEGWWDQFLEQDAMQFSALAPEQVSEFLRHVPIESVFGVARGLNVDSAHRLLQTCPSSRPEMPSEALFEQIKRYPAKGVGKKNVELTQAAAEQWRQRYVAADGFLPPFESLSQSEGLVELCHAWMAPLKEWLAQVAVVLGAELALRYRAYRIDRGIQTYADQVEAALAVLRHAETLDRIRRDGWRVILDEAQDTDSQQFAVLVEITRPPGALMGTWPGHGEPPRQGHFCMVGDGQQAIYGGRADIRNFLRHVDAFRRGEGGELLTFQVTFRAPQNVVELLNQGFTHAFSPERLHNVGLAVADGAPPPNLQVGYEALTSGPKNAEGLASLFELTIPPRPPTSVDGWLREEVTQLARYLASRGPSGVGANDWSEVCVLAPRNDWLMAASNVFEAHGLKVALQVKQQRQGNTPAVAWIAGLLAMICDPENSFEAFGVLREVFAISDGLLAVELRKRGSFAWDEPEMHPEPLAGALRKLRPFILSVDDEGQTPRVFLDNLTNVCALRPRLAALDPSGFQESELDRVLAQAAEFGRDGSSLREWSRDLLNRLDESHAVGKPEPHAINLLTSHSAKGLEWPVVIPIGLWRRVGKPPEAGLRLVPSQDGGYLVYFDNSSVPLDTKESRERERLRELVRLLYVTLTRVRHHLVLPWNPQFGGKQRPGESFAELWAATHLFDPLPRLAGSSHVCCGALDRAAPVIRHRTPASLSAAPQPAAALPARLLPHELGKAGDVVRASKHESSSFDVPFAWKEDDAIDYGLWWHETMEHMPWDAGDDVVDGYAADALKVGEGLGFATRGRTELAQLRGSQAWATLRDRRWIRLAELSIFAPGNPDAWIDGVMDLALHDAASSELWIVDWKTNRRRAAETEQQFFARLLVEYELQLRAYGRSAALFFPGHAIRLWLYSSTAGAWVEIVS